MLDQCRRNHQATVTYERVFLRTKHDDPVLFESSAQAIEPLLERGRLPQSLIIDTSFVIVALHLPRPAAKLLAEESIGDSGVIECTLQLGPVEVRVTLAHRLRAHVSDSCDSCSLKKGEEVRKVVVRVANAEKPGPCQNLWIKLCQRQRLGNIKIRLLFAFHPLHNSRNHSTSS